SANAGFFATSDEGVTWNAINGPSNATDCRFWIDGTDVFAGDFDGGIWVYHEYRSNLSASFGSVEIESLNCMESDSTLYFQIFGNCVPERDSLLSATITGTPGYFLDPTQIIPRAILINDSIKVRYRPQGRGSDTADLKLRFSLNGRIIDTTIRIFGRSTSSPPFASQLTTESGVHSVLIAPGSDTAVIFSLSKDVSAAMGLDSISFDLFYNPQMLGFVSADLPIGWNIVTSEVPIGSIHCMLINQRHSDITKSKQLARFHFTTFLTTDTLSTVLLVPGEAFFDPKIGKACEITQLNEQDSVTFQSVNECGDVTLRQFLATGNTNIRILRIRPNPTFGDITVETESGFPSDVRAAICDDLGRISYQANISLGMQSSFTLPIKDLPAGSYHLLLSSPAGSVGSDFVKIQ
ncbi:MAG: hypothetical protein ABI778_09935, partial [Ignavibacteriota bacterium]